MTTNMSRRFSTMELPTPTYQKDMTNDVRLKLAKVRARSRSFCAPSSSSTASTELKTKKSSQLPRSSVTALTTSAKAKQRQPRSNGRNSTTTTEPSNPVQTLNKRRQSVCSTKPTHHDATTSSSSKTARQPQRNKSSRTTTTKKAHSGISRDNTEQDIMIKFFESDSDEDDLFFRHKSEPAAEMDQDQLQQQQRRQRRTTMPPRLIVSDRRLSSSYSTEQTSVPTNNADKNHDQSMWAELQELKSRLAKLEVQTPTETANNKKLSSICSPPITRPSSITSVISSPHSPLDSACSISNNKETKSHPQKLLQDTVLHLENHFQQDDDPNNTVRNTAFMDTLVDLVAETITINQTLNNFDSQQQRHVSGNFINNITTLQKNSERQINLLADALQSLMVYRQQGSHQHQPVSPPLSQSIMDSESVSPKSTKPYQTTSSLNNYSPLSVRQPRLSNQQCAYPYYLDNPIQSYTDDTSSQHSNLLTATFTNTLSRHQQRQQNRKSAISSSSSAAAAPSNLPLYTKYSDLEQPSTKQVPQQQQTHDQPLSSRPVSGILHQQHHTSYQQQQQQSYYPSSIADQHRQHSLSQSTLQPVASARVHRLLSMYDSMLKPVATGAASTNSSPPMSPPSIQQHQYSHLQHHQDQHSYIDYRHH